METITQGQKVYNPKTGVYEGTAGFNPETGAALSAGQTVPIATPPTNAGQITQTSPINIPTLSPSFGNTTNAVAKNEANKTYDNLAAQRSVDEAAAAKTQADQLAAQQAKSSNSFLSWLQSQPSAAETRNQALSSTGFSAPQYFEQQRAQTAEIDSLSKEYNKINAEKEANINRVQDNTQGLFGEGTVNEEVARIERAYAPRLNELSANINAKTAVMEAQRGNFQDAQTFASQYVQDATAQQKLVVDTFNTFYQVNQDQIDRLDSKYKNSLDYARNLANDEYDKAYKTASLRIDQQLANSKLYTEQLQQKKLLNELPTPSDNTTGLVDKIDTVNSILTNPAIRSAVGPNIFGRIVGSGYDKLTGEKQNFLASTQQLTSQLTLDNLINAKAQGATFGALSEGELNLLAASGSKLNSWAKKDKNGNVTSYRVSEKVFKQELDKINNYAKRDFLLKGGDPTTVGAQTMPDGTVWTTNSDGSLTQLK